MISKLDPMMARNERSARPRIALYSHDTMGLGHLRRNILIASVLAQQPTGADTLVISGTREACHFAMQAGVDCVTLPALCKSKNGDYSAKYLPWDCRQTTKLRSRIIESTIDAFDPDLFIVDKVPRGIGGELEPSLQQIRNRSKTRCVLGLREILDDPKTASRQWKLAQSDQAIEDYYDEVWIYGDQKVYDSLHHYEFSHEVKDRAVFTGYLDQSKRLHVDAERFATKENNRPMVVCTVGGGQDGIKLAAAFAETDLPPGWHGVLITGPYLPEPDRIWLRHTLAGRNDIRLVEDMVESDHFISIADRVVSMAGYNTIASILSFEKPALVVPRMKPRREQWIRASTLAQKGMLSVVEPRRLSAEVIGAWLTSENVQRPVSGLVDLLGLERIVHRVGHLLSNAISFPANSTAEVSIA